MCPACHAARQIFCRPAFNPAAVLAPVRPRIVCHHNFGNAELRFISLNSRRSPRYGLKSLDSSPSTTTKEPPSSTQAKQISDSQIEARLAAAAENKGKWTAVRLHDQYKKTGYTTTQQTLLALLSQSFDEDQLKFYEKALNFKADVSVWAKLVRNASVKSNARTTLALYDAALKSGVRPTSALLQPVLSVLCSGSLRPPTEASIDRAIQLYQQSNELRKDIEPVPEGDVASDVSGDSAGDTCSPDDLGKSDITIYNTLLRAMASTSNITKYFPIALSLLEDLHSRNVATDAMTSTSLVVLLMRTSPTYAEAFKAYRTFTQSDKPRLDGEGYAVVLHTFCNKVSTGTRLPPAHLYLEIMKDMRSAGYPASAKVYTIILRPLATLATRIRSNSDVPPESRQEKLASLAAQIKRVHEAILLDTLTPDTALWNQLMDTYQRAQCFSDALALWEMLYRSSQHDNISVSIILDACSYANAYGIAAKVWDDLTEARFPLNLHNWKTWLECLCRIGQVEEASKVLCLEMGSRKGENVVKPDVEFRERIKRYLPSIWKRLEHLHAP
ncbi:hypothetical protein DAEQUDRAFT_17872 [Daedalea quercina L-15889]|uniref:Pentacotripeptide-repeat region of PRORP domain-containing protein n=1 Tax=Daedalea quercina L-15889 TaxID=1314783 RepID=A0A165UK18_9APHY|nr:hypothetical protein DAEQUDRAFT_17872 [Daedalea quercina L-15889]